MKINNIFRFALCMVALASVTTSCRFEEDDLFDLPASQRQEHSKNEVRDILVSASKDGQNGWLLQYFVSSGGNGSYPGFNMFCKFYNSGCVTIGGDHEYVKNGTAGVYSESDSYYDINKDEATTIALTTWNNVLTPFVNPDGDGVGMYGDCNFIVMGYNNDEILLRGTRHSARSRLYRLDRPYAQYIEGVNARMNSIVNSTLNPYVLKCSNTSAISYIVDISTGRLSLRDRILDPMNNSNAALVFTPDGFRTEKPCKSFDGSFNFQEFVYDKNHDCYVDKDNNAVTLSVAFPNPNDFFMHSLGVDPAKKWYFETSSTASNEFKSLLDAIVSAATSLSNHKYSFVYNPTTNKAVLTFGYSKGRISKEAAYTFDMVRTQSGFQLSNPVCTNNSGLSDATGKKVIAPLEEMINTMCGDLVFSDYETAWSRNGLQMNFSDGSFVIMNK